MKKSMVLAGSLAQRPGKGGHAWVFLQYLLGFRRLGWDVLFVDRLEPAMCVDDRGRPCDVESSWNARYLDRVMRGFGLGESYAVLGADGGTSLGLSRRAVLERAREAEFVLDVMGFLGDEEILTAAPLRVFLDIDPGFPQMWQDLGLACLLRDHDRYVTIGENIGRPECLIPTCGIDWVTTAQPVVMEDWETDAPDGRGGFVSIGAWRGPFDPVEYGGRTYGLRVHEFRRFFDLPRRVDRPFTLALEIHPSEERDLAALRVAGWSLIEPDGVAGDPWRYRDFIRSSMAEVMVAKNMYVRSRSGWFSDRSICFLASGRPVLAQDTGLAPRYPLGEGLLAFSSLDEAVEGAEAIAAEPRRHSRAAREIAREHFDSDCVLPRLLAALGVA